MECTFYEQRDPATGNALILPEKSPFCSSYIARSLTYVAKPQAREMIARVADFLEREKTRGGLWRYWCKDTPRHAEIPADVDDTACISELLRRLGNGAPDNEDLLLANRSSRGLFYTWMVPRITFSANARWWLTVLSDSTYGRLVTFWRTNATHGDIDSVVNANVLLYLGERSETQQVILWLLATAEAGREEESDKWYRSRAAFYYAVSRCYAEGIDQLEGAKEAFGQALSTITHKDGQIGNNALQTSLAACAMMNFGFPVEAYTPSLGYLSRTQQTDGGWESFPLYYAWRSGPIASFGSRAVTTGFCLEALARSE